MFSIGSLFSCGRGEEVGTDLRTGRVSGRYSLLRSVLGRLLGDVVGLAEGPQALVAHGEHDLGAELPLGLIACGASAGAEAVDKMGADGVHEGAADLLVAGWLGDVGVVVAADRSHPVGDLIFVHDVHDVDDAEVEPEANLVHVIDTEVVSEDTHDHAAAAEAVSGQDDRARDVDLGLLREEGVVSRDLDLRVEPEQYVLQGLDLRLAQVADVERLVGEVVGLDLVAVEQGEVGDTHAGQQDRHVRSDGPATNDDHVVLKVFGGDVAAVTEEGWCVFAAHSAVASSREVVL